MAGPEGTDQSLAARMLAPFQPVQSTAEGVNPGSHLTLLTARGCQLVFDSSGRLVNLLPAPAADADPRSGLLDRAWTALANLDRDEGELVEVVRAILATPVPKVTLYSDGDYRVEGDVQVVTGLADGDRTCGCGLPIYLARDPEPTETSASGLWLHRDPPEVWGDDHDARPV